MSQQEQKWLCETLYHIIIPVEEKTQKTGPVTMGSNKKQLKSELTIVRKANLGFS